jgi:hypothetical protein
VVIANLMLYFLSGWGEERVDSAVAGTLNATSPLFTPDRRKRAIERRARQAPFVMAAIPS